MWRNQTLNLIIISQPLCMSMVTTSCKHKWVIKNNPTKLIAKTFKVQSESEVHKSSKQQKRCTYTGYCTHFDLLCTECAQLRKIPELTEWKKPVYHQRVRLSGTWIVEERTVIHCWGVKYYGEPRRLVHCQWWCNSVSDVNQKTAMPQSRVTEKYSTFEIRLWTKFGQRGQDATSSFLVQDPPFFFRDAQEKGQAYMELISKFSLPNWAED